MEKVALEETKRLIHEGHAAILKALGTPGNSGDLGENGGIWRMTEGGCDGQIGWKLDEIELTEFNRAAMWQQ